MRQARRYLVGLALLAGAAAQAQQPPEGARLLQRAISARLTLKLSGERLVTLPDGLTIRERIQRSGMRLRIQITEPESLRESVAVEDGIQRRQFVPDRNEIRIMPSKEAEFYDRMRGSLRAGPRQLRVADGGTVAGRATRVVALPSPGNEGRARFWVDPATGAVLKSEVTGPEGERVASFEFLSVSFDPEFDPGTFVLVKPGAQIVTPLDDLGRLCREKGMPRWHLREQGGWQLVGTRPIGPPNSKALMQSYTNGDMRVSLFHVMGRDVDPQRVGNLVGPGMRVHTVRKGESRLYLVGPLDPSALERLAQRIEQ